MRRNSCRQRQHWSILSGFSFSVQTYHEGTDFPCVTQIDTKITTTDTCRADPRRNHGKVIKSGKNEQIWSNIIRKFDNNNSLKIFSETLLDKLNTEYLDEVYDIQNVIISRKFFSLTINTNNRIKEYSIPIDAYSFLKDLKVFDEVTIRKDTHTEKVFVNWPWIGYEIPLEEFKVSSYQ